MKIEANGISINYELTGNGQYLTLIHGAGDNLNAWYNQVPVFSQHYKVLTYDVQGHGQTQLSDKELTTDLWVEDLYALLKSLNINKTFLLGYSMGGGIASAFTIAHPEMINALILSNGGGIPPQRTEEEMREMAARRQLRIESIKKGGMKAVLEGVNDWFAPGFPEKNPELMKHYKKIIAQNKAEGYLRVMQRMGTPTTPPDFSKINCPTLIIAGEYDSFGGPTAKDTQEAITGAQLRMFPTGHPTFLEQPEEYNETILKFLADVSSG
ncbi:alpha/beta fold hydrolase [Chloroflexota bacterium]